MTAVKLNLQQAIGLSLVVSYEAELVQLAFIVIKMYNYHYFTQPIPRATPISIHRSTRGYR